MGKYIDAFRPAAPSQIAPFKHGESWKKRHRRRYETAVKSEGELRSRCQENGLRLRISNSGEHWQITAKDLTRPLLEWWPSTAKLVIRQQWRAAVHCYDVVQLWSEVEKVLDGCERECHKSHPKPKKKKAKDRGTYTKQLIEALDDAQRVLMLTSDNITLDMRRDPSAASRWEGVPDILNKRVEAIRALLAKSNHGGTDAQVSTD